MYNALANRIWSNSDFQNELRTLIVAHVNFLISETKNAPPIAEDVAQRLLQSAMALCSSTEKVHKETAYRIVTALYTLAKPIYSSLGSFLYLVLSRLGNFPAILYAQHGNVLPSKEIPFLLTLETMHRLLDNTIRIQQDIPDTEIFLTDFQRIVWETLGSGVSLGVTAPTSAGKSFILQAFIRKLWVDQKKPTLVYIVPTRALINQVAYEIMHALKEDRHQDIDIITIPLAADQQVPKNAVFVLTQERLQLILTNHPDMSFDFVIVDEAQALGDGSRGVILTSVLEELKRRNQATQMFFASPNISNPEIFGKLFGLKKYEHHKSKDITVAQNLIHLKTYSTDPKKVSASLHFLNTNLPLIEIRLKEDMPSPELATLQLSQFFGKGGLSLIYAKGAVDCQKTALGLIQTEELKELPQHPIELVQRLKILSEFIKQSVHPEYALAETVLHRVGYHYGAMPPLLRRSIEDSFRYGDLSYLVCTSTLLHGVNLPAKNLFLNRPHTGKDTPINSADFWNLAGRAGRLGKEFEGNVFLIDYDDWENRPLEGAADLMIKSTMQEHLLERTDDFIHYIHDINSKPDSEGRDEFENTFSKIFLDRERGHLEQTLSNLGISTQSASYKQVSDALDFAKTKISLDESVLRISPTVSIYRQQSLYDYLLDRIDEKGPDYLMPVHPLSDKKGAAKASLEGIFRRCHKYIFRWIPTKEDRRDTRAIRAAIYALPWMQGRPFPQIIDNHFAYYSKKNTSHTISKSILETLDAIEKEIRFTYVKLTGCYNVLLREALLHKGYHDKAEAIVPIPLFLEVGACSQTMMSFIGLGLSRITSRILSDAASRSSLGPAEAKMWLRTQKLEIFGLSPIIIDEVKRVL